MEFGLAPIQSEPTFERMIAQSQLAESLGFDALWVHEHHSQAMMYPSPLMALAALAGRTERIRLGTNMLLLPLYHPLRVAEEGAMLDVLCGGRFVLGVSAGYARDEFPAFETSLRDRGRRMEEGLTLIRAVWEQERVTLEGTGWRLENYELFPRPLQRPAPPIYVGALSDRAISRAARVGDGYVLSAGSTLLEVQERIAVYERALRDVGKTLAGQQPLAINRVVHVVATQAEKKRAEEFFADRFLSFYDRWGHADVVKLDSRQRTFEETVRQHFILGEPSECIEQIERYAELGIGHIACLMSFGKPDPEVALASLRRFGESVLPVCAGI